MAKRISLPSSGEIFDVPTPTAGGGHRAPLPKSSRSAEPTGRRRSPRATRATPPETRRSRTPTPATRSAAVGRPSAATVRRLERIEDGLGQLPVDTLLDLRAGLDELLAADSVSEAALVGLLDRISR